LSHSELLELKRWDTPTVYNGWAKITKHDIVRKGMNPEACHDFMPHLGSMIGYAVTLVIEPSNPEHAKDNPSCWSQFRRYVADASGPKIVVVQDLDKPRFCGCFWGEVNSNMHQALGCVGTIVDGGIRDYNGMCNAGFKALATRFCLADGHVVPLRWNCEVQVFGQTVRPGQLIHADQHGFLVIPEEDQGKLLNAVRFLDTNECRTMIRAGRSKAGKSTEQLLTDFDEAFEAFDRANEERFGPDGEENRGPTTSSNSRNGRVSYRPRNNRLPTGRTG
jgi:regulator of RNase E activity RraA